MAPAQLMQRGINTLTVLVLLAVNACIPARASAQPDSDLFLFQSQLMRLTATLVNPYSGATIHVDEDLYVNTGTYFGGAGQDILLMDINSEFLQLERGGVQYIDQVEICDATDGRDIVILSHPTILFVSAEVALGDGDDLLWMNVGNDQVNGGRGTDVIDGGPGNDQIFGDEDRDTLNGGAGNDIIDGGTGDDLISGDSGTDSFVFAPGGGADTICELFDGEDDILKICQSAPPANPAWVVARLGRDLRIVLTWPAAAGSAAAIIKDQFDGSGAGVARLQLTDGSNLPLPHCPADYNASNQVSVQDLFDFLAGYFAVDATADFNQSGSVSVQDIFDFLAAYFAGCA